MKRPEQHEIDSKGISLFRQIFANWAVNPSEQDYGWDFIVEIFRNNTSTGFLFPAQLKSSKVTKYASTGNFLSQTLEINAADYLARQLQQPTMLFHADVERQKLYWTAVQLDADLLSALERRDTGSITVRIPTANVLPDAFDEFLSDLQRAHAVVLARALRIVSDTNFVDAMRKHPVENRDDIAEDLHEKAHRIEAQNAHEIFQGGDIAEAIQRLKGILASPDATLNVRFNVTLQLGELEWIAIVKSGRPQQEAAEHLAGVGRELCRIAKHVSPDLRLFALMARCAGELGVILHRHLGLTMNWKAQVGRSSDPLWIAQLTFELNENLASAGRKYKQGLRVARLIANSPYRWSASPAIVRLARELPLLAGLLDQAALKEAAHQYRKSAFQLFRLAAAIAIENKNLDDLFSVVTLVLLIDASPEGEVFKWSRSIVEKWKPESEYRKRADAYTSNLLNRSKGIKTEYDIVTTVRQVHENILAGFGINPLTQPFAGYIDLAVMDANPERVLKGCEHTLVTAAPRSPMLDRLCLQAAGPKTLHCTLHRVAVTGPDLDSINETFVSKYCSSCSDRVQRPGDWAFSDEWQDGENKKWVDYIKQFRY